MLIQLKKSGHLECKTTEPFMIASCGRSCQLAATHLVTSFSRLCVTHHLLSKLFPHSSGDDVLDCAVGWCSPSITCFSVCCFRQHTPAHTKTYTSVHSGKTTEEFNSFSFVSCRGHILRMTSHWREITLKLYTSLSRTVDRKTVTTQIAHTQTDHNCSG